MSRTLTDREENASPDSTTPQRRCWKARCTGWPQLRRDLKAALDEMRAARMIALAAEAKETNA
jgi:hypothetical protein